MPEYHIPARQSQPEIDPVTGALVNRNPAQESAPQPSPVQQPAPPQPEPEPLPQPQPEPQPQPPQQ